MWSASAPVVVGIDGSDAAINAATWAIDEAVSRDVPLRLVHVTHIDEPSPARVGEDYRLDVQFAEASLRAASAAVHATGKHVKLETEVLWGAVNTALIDESADAAMICIGSIGIGAVAREFTGSTAVAVAENAYCPVAIIRTPHQPPAIGEDWIVVVVEDRADNDSVIEHAMDEARLRKAPVLAVGVWREDLGEEPYDELDRRVEVWKERYHDVHVQPVASPASIERFLAEHKDESVQLAVVGRGDATSVAEIIGPHGHALIPHGACSVLIVR